jgi:uncharacterized phage-associated protein
MSFPFSHRKSTQVLNFFALQAGGQLNKLKALKLVYFADRYHLRRFGRPITGDEYYAMTFGPVASGAKDLIERDSFLSDEEVAYSSQFIAPVDRYTYRSTAEFAPAVLSQSDRTALTWAWDTFGHRDGFELADATHAYPEWQNHAATIEGKRETRVPMCYRDFLQDPAPGVEPCHPLDAEQRAALAAGIQERFDAERLLS